MLWFFGIYLTICAFFFIFYMVTYGFNSVEDLLHMTMLSICWPYLVYELARKL